MKLLPAWKIIKVDNYAMGLEDIWEDNQSSGCIIRPLHEPYNPWQWHASNFSWHHQCWIKHWGHEKLQAFFTRPDPNLSHFSSPSQLEAQLTIALRLTSGTGYKKKRNDHPQKKNSLHEYHGKYMMKSRENTLTDKNWCLLMIGCKGEECLSTTPWCYGR